MPLFRGAPAGVGLVGVIVGELVNHHFPACIENIIVIGLVVGVGVGVGGRVLNVEKLHENSHHAVVGRHNISSVLLDCLEERAEKLRGDCAE